MSQYPKATEVLTGIPTHVKRDLFEDGFQHSIRGGQLTDPKVHFKMSFREGFRAGRLYLKELRRQQGVVEFPLQGKIKVTVS